MWGSKTWKIGQYIRAMCVDMANQKKMIDYSVRCSGREKRRLSNELVRFCFLRWVVYLMAIWFNLYFCTLFLIYVIFYNLKMYKLMPSSKNSEDAIHCPGWWFGQGTVVSNSVYQVIFWFLSLWQPPQPGKCLGWPVSTVAWECHAFLGSFGLMSSCSNISSLLLVQTSQQSLPKKAT